MTKAQRVAYLKRRIGRLIELYVSISLRVGDDPTLDARLVTARTELYDTLGRLAHEAA